MKLEARSRSAEVRIDPPPGPGARVLMSGAALPGTTTVDPDPAGRARIRGLAAGAHVTVTCLSAAGTKLSTPVTRATPPLLRIHQLVCLPSDRLALVDFEWTGAPSVRVELHLAGEDRPVDRLERQGTPFHHLFSGLRPETEYALRISADGAWGGLDEYHFWTPRQKRDIVIETISSNLRSRDHLRRQLAVDWLGNTRDPRVVIFVHDFLQSGNVPRHTWIDLANLIGRFRDLHTAAALSVRVRPSIETMPFPDQAAIIRGLALARDPWALGQARRILAGPFETIPHHRQRFLADLAQVLSRTGSGDNWAAIEHAVSRVGPDEDALLSLLRLDTPRTRRMLRSWIAPRVPLSPQVEVLAFRALAAQGDPGDVEWLGQMARSGAPRSRRARAVLALASMGPEADRWILEAFRENRHEKSHIWALAWRGIRAAAPDVIRQVEAAADPELRWDAVLVLGLLGDATARPALERILAGESGPLAGAAAWALGRLGDPGAWPSVETLALSGKDRSGAAIWALGTLGRERARRSLRRLIERFNGRPSFPDQVQLAVATEELGRFQGVEDVRWLRWVQATEVNLEFVRRQAERAVNREGPEAGTVSRVHFPFVLVDRTGVLARGDQVVHLLADGAWGHAGAPAGMRPVLEPSRGGESEPEIRLRCLQGPHAFDQAGPMVLPWVVDDRSRELVVGPCDPLELDIDRWVPSRLGGVAFVSLGRTGTRLTRRRPDSMREMD